MEASMKPVPLPAPYQQTPPRRQTYEPVRLSEVQL